MEHCEQLKKIGAKSASGGMPSDDGAESHKSSRTEELATIMATIRTLQQETHEPMKTTVTYLFDPLCGWCYGASPMIQKLSQQSSLRLELAPTGLFAGANGRALNAEFAQYAWSNDLRIGKMTGQVFSEQYRSDVLGKSGSRLDSATATLALTAVSLTDPAREIETLKLIQEARYVHGLDITSTCRC